jgi:anti-sigma regulatory factor (Ser/Thr protein kinase)
VVTTSYTHEALFFDSRPALLEAAVPWLREGLQAGDHVLLVCTDDNNAALADALGQDPHVTVLPRTRIYRKAVDAVAFFHDLVTARVAAGQSRVRLVGEVGFDTGPLGHDEWCRYEAVCNHALAPLPLWSVCAYDTHVLPRPLLDTAWATHPWLRAGGARARNGDFVQPALLLRDLARPLESPAAEAATSTLTELGELPRLRRWLQAGLADAQVGTEAAENAVLAVDEVAANGLRHGRPPVEVALWLTPSGVVCDVTDRGTGITDPLAGYTPPDPLQLLEGGVGLWMTRRLCEGVTTGWTPTGFTVRLTLASAAA